MNRRTFDVVKRAFDIVAAGIALALLSPIIAITALLVRTRLGSPILYNRPRAGRDGREFTCLKFRTMTDERGADGALLPDADRLTRFGHALRSTSLDELPQLINVLRGDMSIVGPRPLLMEYIPHYSEFQARRHEVRPGITGYAQVNGRNTIDWETRFEMDVWYVDNRSLKIDTWIILKSIAIVLSRKGVVTGTEPTMPRFEGSNGTGDRAS